MDETGRSQAHIKAYTITYSSNPVKVTDDLEKKESHKFLAETQVKLEGSKEPSQKSE